MPSARWTPAASQIKYLASLKYSSYENSKLMIESMGFSLLFILSQFYTHFSCVENWSKVLSNSNSVGKTAKSLMIGKLTR